MIIFSSKKTDTRKSVCFLSLELFQMCAGGFEHQLLGGTGIKGHLHQCIAAHGTDRQHHAAAKGGVRSCRPWQAASILPQGLQSGFPGRKKPAAQPLCHSCSLCWGGRMYNRRRNHRRKSFRRSLRRSSGRRRRCRPLPCRIWAGACSPSACSPPGSLPGSGKLRWGWCGRRAYAGEHG